MAPRNPERTIRAYLTFLEDPARAVDPDAVEAAEEAVRTAVDPIEKVVALSDLARARQPDEATLRAGFVAHAATWCQRRRVTAAALVQFGVPADVLADAGLTNGRPPDGPTTVAMWPGATAQLPRGKDFRASEYAVLAGIPVERARKQLARFVDAGLVVIVGSDPTWKSRGAKPILYRAAGDGGESGI